MHSRRFIEDEPEVIRSALTARNHSFDLNSLLDELEGRKTLRGDLESLQAKRNAGSKEVGQLFKYGQREEGQKLREELAGLGDRIDTLEEQVKELEESIDTEILGLPNLVASDVPVGKDESDNVEVASWGEIPSFDFEVSDHHSLGEERDLFDFERGAKITGARFSVLKGEAARMNRPPPSAMMGIPVP